MDFVNGTCGNCKLRFRFWGEDLISGKITKCPNCGYEFSDENLKNLYIFAEIGRRKN